MDETNDTESKSSKADQCSICLNDYVDPKQLPCLHIFCGQCLHKLADRTKLTKHFDCPLCRAKTKVPNGGVYTFPSNTNDGNTNSHNVYSGPSADGNEGAPNAEKDHHIVAGLDTDDELDSIVVDSESDDDAHAPQWTIIQIHRKEILVRLLASALNFVVFFLQVFFLFMFIFVLLLPITTRGDDKGKYVEFPEYSIMENGVDNVYLDDIG